MVVNVVVLVSIMTHNPGYLPVTVLSVLIMIIALMRLTMMMSSACMTVMMGMTFMCVVFTVQVIFIVERHSS